MAEARECVVPAAGASSRMGAWKPLLAWGPSTIIETVVSNINEAGLEAIVVAGYRGEELHALFRGKPGVAVVDNPDWEAGMAGSIMRGALEVRGSRFFTLPADMPGVGLKLFTTLIDDLHEADGTLFAACGGRAGHPVLLPLSLIQGLSKLESGTRLRDYLLTRPHRFVETGDPAVLADLDTPAEYRAAVGIRP